MIPVRDDRTAWRHVPWGGAGSDEEWVLLGENLTGATLRLQVRPSEGDTAAPLIDLSGAAAGTEGLSLTYDAGYVDTETSAVVGATVIMPYVLKATLEAIAPASDPAQPRELVYDLQVTASGGIARLRCFGSFTLMPGVTAP